MMVNKNKRRHATVILELLDSPHGCCCVLLVSEGNHDARGDCSADLIRHPLDVHHYQGDDEDELLPSSAYV